jgi:hypothetical protein
MEILDFEAFLRQKKIDPGKFKKEDPALYEELRTLYNQVHPGSFIAQKLFLINRIRRKYTFSEKPSEETPPSSGPAKPRIPVKPKINR